MSKKVFIGVAWPYLNGDIHIGHLAGYLLPADIYARFNRYIGNEVLMVSGSDCFGTPVMIEAEKRGVKPQEIVQEYHQKNVELFKFLGISFDIYTKTDTPNHKKIVQEIFLSLLKKGFIFKSETEQYFSESEKRFLPDRYVEGECPNCGNKAARGDQCDSCGEIFGQGELKNPKSRISGGKVGLRPTEHYFLDWPKFQLFLEKYVEEKGGPFGKLRAGWRPWVFKETMGWLKEGLKPRPITRDLEWGVEIPIDKIPADLKIQDAEHKRIYVWFEAVIGYLSASIEWSTLRQAQGRNWKDFWHGEDLFHAYFIGKDNLAFHTLFWPGELHAYDEKLRLPDFPAVNQFLTLEGRKFSKSRGVTIDSRYIVQAYGLDPVRFYLCLIMPENADANFSWADFVSKNNDLLIGNFGNFVNRTLVLAKGLNFKTGGEFDAKLTAAASSLIAEARANLGNFEFKKYAETILSLSDLGNKYLSRKSPWLMENKKSEEFKEAIFNSLFVVLGLLLIIKPLLPEAAEKLAKMLGVEFDTWPEDGYEGLLKTKLKEVKISKAEALFRKIEPEAIEKERVKISLKAK